MGGRGNLVSLFERERDVRMRASMGLSNNE